MNELEKIFDTILECITISEDSVDYIDYGVRIEHLIYKFLKKDIVHKLVYDYLVEYGDNVPIHYIDEIFLQYIKETKEFNITNPELYEFILMEFIDLDDPLSVLKHNIKDKIEQKLGIEIKFII